MAKNGVSLKNESWRLGIGFYQINVDQIARCAHTHRRYIYIHIHDTHIIYTRRDENCLFIKKCVLHGTYIFG
jgi:hypothetical protein